MLIANYKASVDEVSFSSDGEKIRKDVNEWVNQKTSGMIKSLLDKKLSEDTRAILLNAIYFKGKWTDQFKLEKTKEATFFNGDGTEAKVAFMEHSRRSFNLGELQLAGENVQILELPYDGSVSMFIVLPDERNGLKNLEPKLNIEELEKVTSNLYKSRQVNVWLPKFKFEMKTVLNDLLAKLGIETIFTREADLSGVNGLTNLYVSEVLHKAVIEVNEEGTEAAAATAAVMMMRSMPMEHDFRADHPFLFFIKEKASNVMLFFGRVDKF